MPNALPFPENGRLGPMSQVPASEMQRITFLDGIRGWASVVVLLSHAIPCFLGSKYPFLNVAALRWATDGNFAVSIFFVLSGIALTINYFRTGDAKVLLHLIVRRYPRLFIPIAASTLLGVAMLRLGLFFNHEAAPLLKNSWWLANHFSDVRNIHEILDFITREVFFEKVHPWGYNINLWTMNVEFLGSFVAFAFCLFVMPLRRFAPVALVAVFLSYRFNFYLPFIAGVLLARFIHPLLLLPGRSKALSRVCVAVSLAALAAVAVYAALSRNLEIDAPVLPRAEPYATLAACLAIAAVCINKPLRSRLSGPLSKELGHVSFPLYLTHLFVICSLSCFVALHLPGLDGPLPAITLIAVSVAGSLAAAWAFTPIERLAVALSRRISKSIV